MKCPLNFALLLATILAAGVHGAKAAGQDSGLVVVSPKQTEEVFANPGMGWQTFHCFADDDKNLAGLPSSSAYFRFYWRELEPAEGEINFKLIDDLLAHARRAGQKLALRIMCTGSGERLDVPQWLERNGCSGFEFTYGGRKHWVPNFADEKFRSAHQRLVRELGRRYDQHPEFDLLDIGSVGLWGEWHMSGTSRTDTGKPVDLPPTQLRMSVIEEWRRAFPQTSKVVLIGSEEGMSQTAATGLGWRADCLGDMGGFSKNWNHMDNFYLQQIEKTGAQDAWKKAPVAFESCWDMRKWKESGWDIPAIFDYALRCHASYMNNKSAPIPEGTRPEVERFLRHLGYRLVVHKVQHAPAVKAGEVVPVEVQWENVGVAPPYRSCAAAVGLFSTGVSTNLTAWQIGDSVRGWQPGTHRTALRLTLPRDCAAGRYQLAVGVLNPNTSQPEIRLAISGPTNAGWHIVSQLEIRSR